eukprot:1286587-Ditylum_brightwellii.AAC.1
MDMVLSSQGKMVEEVVEVIKSELDEAHYNKVIDQINHLEGTTAQADPSEERRRIFESCPLHSWGGKLQGLPCDWAMPRPTLNGAILMWHM